METFTFKGPKGRIIKVTAESYLQACEILVGRLGWEVDDEDY
jgi:hypothetical protein